MGEILLALEDVVAGAREEDKQRLAQALENYSKRFSHSWNRMNKGNKPLAKIMWVLVMGTDARPDEEI